MGQDPAAAALIDEAMKKSGLIWIGLAGSTQRRAFWHVWLDGKAYLLTGGGEQPDPGFAERATVDVLVRSKDNAHRLLVLRATVTLLLRTDADWPTATQELAKGRLNLSAAEEAPARWASDRSYRLYRLTPTGEILEGPGAAAGGSVTLGAGVAPTPGGYPTDSLRATPVDSPATTRSRLPWVLHRRDTRRRPLS